MALMHMEDWFGNDASNYTLSGDNVWGASRFGSQTALNSRFINSTAKRIFTPTNEVILGVAYYFNPGGTYPAPLITFFGDTTTTHVEVKFNLTSMSLDIYVGGSLVASGSTPAIRLSSWNYYEVKARLHDTTGYVEARAQGIITPVVTFSGDTKAGGTSPNFNAYQINFEQGCSICDIYLLDTTGSRLNDFIGEQKVLASIPNGPGATTGFTPSTGVNWQNVDETPASSADYNSASASGTRDTYAMTDIPGNSVISAVRADFYAHRNDTDPVSLKMATRIGSTVYYGSAVGLTTSMVRNEQQMELSPATSAPWTVAEFNGAEFGAEVV